MGHLLIDGQCINDWQEKVWTVLTDNFFLFKSLRMFC